MARRRIPPSPAADAIPPELTDPDHPAWSSQAAAEAIVRRHGLEPHWHPAPPSMLRDPGWERFKAVRHAWATRAGMLTGDHGLDFKRLAQAGVYAGHRGPRIRGEHGTTDLGARRLIIDPDT